MSGRTRTNTCIALIEQSNRQLSVGRAPTNRTAFMTAARPDNSPIFTYPSRPVGLVRLFIRDQHHPTLCLYVLLWIQIRHYTCALKDSANSANSVNLPCLVPISASPCLPPRDCLLCPLCLSNTTCPTLTSVIRAYAFSPGDGSLQCGREIDI